MIATRPGMLGIERSQAYPTAALVSGLQSRARIPLLVAGDFERGTAMRLEEGTSFPHAMAVAAARRPEDAYTMGRITALEARAAPAAKTEKARVRLRNVFSIPEPSERNQDHC